MGILPLPPDGLPNANLYAFTFLLRGVTKGGWICLLDVISRQPGYSIVKQKLFDDRLWNHCPPTLSSWILACDGHYVEGYGVVNLPDDAKIGHYERIFDTLPSPSGSASCGRLGMLSRLGCQKKIVELSSLAANSWVRLGDAMKALEEVELCIDGVVQKFDKIDVGAKAVSLNFNNAIAWHNLGWYMHCYGRKEYTFKDCDVTLTPKSCLVAALGLIHREDIENISPWDTLASILGRHEVVSLHDVKATELLLGGWVTLPLNLKPVFEAASCGSLDDSRCISLAIQRGLPRAVTFFHMALCLEYRNKTLSIQSIQRDAIIRALRYRNTSIGEESIGDVLSASQCFDIAWSLGETDLVVSLVSSEPHLVADLLRFMPFERLSDASRRLLRKEGLA